MRRLWTGGLLWLVLGVTGAHAAGYDDFASGLSAVNRGDNDKAIGFFTTALAAGDLNANLVPVAYLERARAHLDKAECAAAIADATAALKLKTDYFEGYQLRAVADRCARLDPEAIADFTQVIAIRDLDGAYWERAHARWNVGDFENAAADFSTAAERSPKWAYPVIWFGLSKLRAGTFDGIDYIMRYRPFHVSDWPGPVFQLYEGRAKPEDVLQAAEKGDAKAAKDNLCEAQFYVAEWWLVQKNAETAKPLLKGVQNSCRHDFIEYRAALVELGRLK
jgi:lipoprotein NlpI